MEFVDVGFVYVSEYSTHTENPRSYWCVSSSLLHHDWWHLPVSHQKCDFGLWNTQLCGVGGLGFCVRLVSVKAFDFNRPFTNTFETHVCLHISETHRRNTERCVDMSSTAAVMRARRELNDTRWKHIKNTCVISSIFIEWASALQAQGHIHKTCINTCTFLMISWNIAQKIVSSQKLSWPCLSFLFASLLFTSDDLARDGLRNLTVFHGSSNLAPYTVNICNTLNPPLQCTAPRFSTPRPGGMRGSD